MVDCVFCGIAEGEIDAEIVFENDYAVGFLDANPIADGHAVVVPKEHFERFSDLTEEVATGMFAVVKEVNGAIVSGLGADGANIGINDGEAAGQAIPHVHVHLIPRYRGDGGGSLHSIVEGSVQEDLGEIGEKLRGETYGD
ncbi:MAG: HIT family protein [Candidatus Acetothermia bacterium]